jgi:hypothetical protein
MNPLVRISTRKSTPRATELGFTQGTSSGSVDFPIVALALLGLFISLTFRQGGLIEEFENRGLSPTTEFLRSNGYYITGGIILVCAGLMVSIRKSFGSSLGVSVIAVNVLFLAALRVRDSSQQGNITMAWLAVVLALSIVVVLAWLLPAIILAGEFRGIHALKVIHLSALAWAMISIAEWLRSSHSAEWVGRFLGISGHPNHAGTIAAIGFLAGFALFRATPAGWHKGGLAIGASVFIVLLFWSGARSALVLCFTGLVWQLLAKKVAGLVIPCFLLLVSVLILSTILPEDSNADGVLRAISMKNTRAEAWSVLWKAFVENPVVGTGVAEFSENAYLVILARSGLVGGSIFISFWIIAIIKVVSANKAESIGERRVDDGLTSIVIGTISVGLFEGVLKDELSFPIFSVYLAIVTVGARNSLRCVTNHGPA